MYPIACRLAASANALFDSTAGIACKNRPRYVHCHRLRRIDRQLPDFLFQKCRKCSYSWIVKQLDVGKLCPVLLVDGNNHLDSEEGIQTELNERFINIDKSGFNLQHRSEDSFELLLQFVSADCCSDR